MTPFCGIIGHKHSQVFYDLDTMDFASLIEKNGLQKDDENPTLVRFYCYPKGDFFDKSAKNWVCRFDPFRAPDWFDEELAEKQAREALADFFDKRVLIGQKIDKLTSGRWFLKDCEPKDISGNHLLYSVTSGFEAIFIVDPPRVYGMFID